MSYKTLVVTDMDGTLLDDEKKISPETCGYLFGLQEKGIVIAIASGRPYRAIKPYYDQIGLKGKVICYNGGIIINPQKNDEILYEKSYPKDFVVSVIERIGLRNFRNVLCEDMRNVFLAYDNDSMKRFSYLNGMNVVIGNRFAEMKNNPLGVLFSLKDESHYNELLRIGSALPEIGIRFWENSLTAELYFNEVNKYTSLMRIAKAEDISRKDIICFGDADNDIEMIYRSGIGVGMKNGTPNVHRYASMISLDDNNHDGVMKTLQLLIHR